MAQDETVNRMAACSSALVPSNVFETQNRVMQLAVLSSAIQRSSSSDEWSSNASGLIAGNPVMASLDNARARQAELERTLNVSLDVNEASAYVYNFLPPSASDSYNRCITEVFGAGKLQITSQVIDETNALIRINWPGRPGESEPYLLRVRSNGTTEPRNTMIAASGGAIEIVVSRANPARSLVVTGELVRSGDPLTVPISSTSVTFPPVIRYRQADPEVTELRSEVAEAFCGVRYGTPRRVAPDIYLVATHPGAILSNVRFEARDLPADHLLGMNNNPAHRGGLFIDEESPTQVRGHAECGVGDGRNMHAVRGQIVATQTVIRVTRQEPQDNNRYPAVRLILPAEPAS